MRASCYPDLFTEPKPADAPNLQVADNAISGGLISHGRTEPAIHRISDARRDSNCSSERLYFRCDPFVPGGTEAVRRRRAQHEILRREVGRSRDRRLLG